MATLLVPSYLNGLSSVMVVQALSLKLTDPLNTLLAVVTGIQSLVPVKLLLSVLTM